MAKLHTYEVVYHHKKPPVKEQIWWDGKKVQSTSPSLLARMKELYLDGATEEDIAQRMARVTCHYKSGYITSHKVKDTK